MAQVAKSITRYYKFFRHQGAVSVLDYGAGLLRNSVYLSGEGFTVYAADLPDQAARLRTSAAAAMVAGIFDVDQLPGSGLRVDLVLSTYVFNIIATSADRCSYLENVTEVLNPGGYLLIEVRCRQPGKCGKGCVDYFTCSNCAKTFTHDEMDSVLHPYGFKRVSHYYCKHALTAVYRLAH